MEKAPCLPPFQFLAAVVKWAGLFEIPNRKATMRSFLLLPLLLCCSCALYIPAPERDHRFGVFHESSVERHEVRDERAEEAKAAPTVVIVAPESPGNR